MKKVSKKHPLRLAGWERVEIPSHLLDSIWQKDGMLHIRFATGECCTFGKLKEEN
jgi:hypothetical protein